MIRKIGIAAVCGLALYGIAKLISRHVVVVSNVSFLDPIDAKNGLNPGGEIANVESERSPSVTATVCVEASGDVASADPLVVDAEATAKQPANAPHEAPAL
jgi:hypothetical protein